MTMLKWFIALIMGVKKGKERGRKRGRKIERENRIKENKGKRIRLKIKYVAFGAIRIDQRSIIQIAIGLLCEGIQC